MKKSWFTMAAVALASGGVSAQVDIHDEIGYWGVSATDFMTELKGLGDVKEINLSVHSPGGEVLDGWAIYNVLKNHAATVVGRVEGFAGSMASVILMACDEVQMPSNSYMMIHNVSGGCRGTSDDMRDQAALIDKLSEGIANSYATKTGLELEEITAMMDAETWMSGAEAKEKGFADTVLSEVKAAACATVGNYSFKNMPEAAKEALKVAADESDESTFQKIKNLINGKKQVATAPDVTALHSELANLRLEMKATNRERDLALEGLDKMTAQMAVEKERADKLDAEMRETYDIIADAGFDSESLRNLPAPGAEDGPTGTAYETYKAMEKGPEKTEFFKRNKSEILATVNR